MWIIHLNETVTGVSLLCIWCKPHRLTHVVEIIQRKENTTLPYSFVPLQQCLCAHPRHRARLIGCSLYEAGAEEFLVRFSEGPLTTRLLTNPN